MSTMSIPGPVQQLIDRGLIETDDVDAAFADRAAHTAVYSALTEGQQSTLLEESGLDAAGRAAVRDRWDHPERAAVDTQAKQTRDDLELLAGSETTRQVATRLRVAATTVTRWHAKGAIVGFTDGRGRTRFPSWQFTPAGPLPGWATVAPHAAGLPMTAIEALMHQPQDEMSGSTPVEFLASGGDPTRIAGLVDGLRTW